MNARRTDPVWQLQERGFDVEYRSHAQAILTTDFSPQLTELVHILLDSSLPITEIIGSGGGESRFTQRLRRQFAEHGWRKHNFVVSKEIDGVPRQSTSHEVDHVCTVEGVGTLGCEIEWNNKDPFFDRDLENFKRLHAEGAISAGIIITRGSSLQGALSSFVRRYAEEHGIGSFDALMRSGVRPTEKQEREIRARVERARDPVNFADAWAENFVGSKFGAATTHWEKLQVRVKRGVGNPCPLLLIGLPASIITFDVAAA